MFDEFWDECIILFELPSDQKWSNCTIKQLMFEDQSKIMNLFIQLGKIWKKFTFLQNLFNLIGQINLQWSNLKIKFIKLENFNWLNSFSNSINNGKKQVIF